MLPLGLVRSRTRGSELLPRWIDPSDAELLDLAAEIVALFQEAAAARWTRGRLDEELHDLSAMPVDKKLFDGLVKLCGDRVAAVADPDINPTELRAEVFQLARERGPLAYERGPLGAAVAADVLAEVGLRRNLDPGRIAAALYADLKEAHQVVAFDITEPVWLLQRYNLALAQGLLLAATRVRIRLQRPTPARIRQLLRRAHFQQLIHTAHLENEDLIVDLDGPLSMFEQSTRYGFQLAAFLPTLVLQQGPWSLEADLVWTPRRLARRLTIDHTAGLVSPSRDDGAHQTREELWFVERFELHNTEWTLDAATLPIDLGGRGFAMPDFTLRLGKRVAHLEIVGFWKAEGLAKRLDLLRRYGPGNIILAVSRKLCADGEGSTEAGVELVPFANVVPVKDVLLAAERVAR